MTGKILFSVALCALLALNACARQSVQTRDAKADEKLRVEKMDAAAETDQALEDLQEKEEQQRSRDLERQINDSLVESNAQR